MNTDALAIRTEWLTRMGLSAEEIAEDIRLRPLNLQDEIENLEALDKLKALNETYTARRVC